MMTFEVYDKKTMLYVGEITIKLSEVRIYEKDFILK